MTKINTDFITLGQLLKIEDIVGSGGEVKHFLSVSKVFVNNEIENRRGRKCYPGDEIKVKGRKFIIEK